MASERDDDQRELQVGRQAHGVADRHRHQRHHARVARWSPPSEHRVHAQLVALRRHRTPCRCAAIRRVPRAARPGRWRSCASSEVMSTTHGARGDARDSSVRSRPDSRFMSRCRLSSSGNAISAQPTGRGAFSAPAPPGTAWPPTSTMPLLRGRGSRSCGLQARHAPARAAVGAAAPRRGAAPCRPRSRKATFVGAHARLEVVERRHDRRLVRVGSRNTPVKPESRARLRAVRDRRCRRGWLEQALQQLAALAHAFGQLVVRRWLDRLKRSAAKLTTCTASSSTRNTSAMRAARDPAPAAVGALSLRESRPRRA